MPQGVLLPTALIGAVLSAALTANAQQCSNESFSIGYNGVTAFEVSNVDSACRCAGAVTSDRGVSRADTLSVNNLVVTNASNLPCPSTCHAPLSSALTQIATLNATVVSLQATVASVQSQGCSGGGGGGGGGGNGIRFCVVPALPNGYVVGRAGRVIDGATVTYACDNGFNFTGFASQTCVSGQFDHELPQCIPLPCASTAPSNGATSGAVVPSGSTVTYSCNTGYALNGTATQTCYATRFNDSAPSCYGLPCTAVAPTYGSVSSTSVAHAASATYSCSSGFTLSGSSTRTCTATVLSGSQPVCNGDPCALPGAPSGSSSVPSSGNVAHNSALVYTCNSGYTWTAGNLTRRCWAGALDGVAPTCTPNPCTTVAPGNGSVSATSVPHGGSVTYSCNVGYSIMGVATQTCSAGSLSNSLPTCGQGYRNCYAAKQGNPSAPTGIYPIDPDGSGSAPRINVFCDMTTDGGGWASIFTLSGSLSLGGTTCMFSYGNDDMDSTIMWSDLTCKVSNANADNTDGAKYFTVTRGGSADQSSTVLQPRPAGVNGYARPCPLPGSQRVVWFDWQTSMIYWGSGSASFASVGIGSYTNCYSSYGSNFFIISDNIDTILTGCPSYGNTLLRFNFEDNTVTGTYVSSTFYPQSSNWFVTEQDEFGVVLFTVNGKIFYYNGGSYYALGGTLGNPNVFTNQWAVSRPSGYDTQFGIDMTGWVDTSGRLWLADWGHDDGGYFACSNDYQLGTAPTNIMLTY